MDTGESSYNRFLNGDRNAFDEIIKAYFDHVVFFADSILHDVYASEDVAIDVFAYLAFRKGYDGRSSLRTYLLTIARSRAFNALKKKKAHPVVSLEEAEDERERAQIADSILQSERKQSLMRAMGKLPENMRAVLHLVYFEDLSYKEAAKVTGKSEKQIDNLLYRAKNALRVELKKEGYGFEEF